MIGSAVPSCTDQKPLEYDLIRTMKMYEVKRQLKNLAHVQQDFVNESKAVDGDGEYTSQQFPYMDSLEHLKCNNRGISKSAEAHIMCRIISHL